MRNGFSQKGFTLVELVIVIAILGILSAVALPRFADFTTSAKTSARAGTVAALNSAIGIVHAKWVSAGGTGTTVAMDGGVTITVNAAGYPDVAGTAYASAANCTTLINGLLGGTSAASGLGTIGYTTGCTIAGSPAFPTVLTLTATDAS